MNSIINDHYPVFEMYQSLRTQLMGIVSDADLSFSPGGDNSTLGELCREIGEVQQSYIDSFRTFTQDFSTGTMIQPLRAASKGCQHGIRHWTPSSRRP